MKVEIFRNTVKRRGVGHSYDMLFAWKVAWFTKSNAIVYARDLQTIGVGAGQMSRVIRWGFQYYLYNTNTPTLHGKKKYTYT